MLKIMLAALCILAPAQAFAQLAVVNSPADLTTVNAQIAAISAAMPIPASTVPPAEAVTPTVGTPGTYRPADSVVPRITRAGSCTLVTGGTCTVTWATALASSPNVIISPINTAAAQPISCNATATPTTTGVSIKCWIDQQTTLSLAIITAGLNLAPSTPAPTGTVVQVIAIPATQ